MAIATKAEPDQKVNNYSIRAVDRVCDILDLLQNEPEGLSLQRAADVVGLPKSSVFRYLATLEERRYVERDPATGTFRIGLALLPLQARQLGVVSQRSRPYLEALQQQFGETANLGLLDGNKVTYLSIVESPHAMRLASRPGDRDPIHSTSLGKAIAAELPDERVKEILRAEGMPRRTDSTLTRQKDFFEALAQAREIGYAVDDGENEIGGRCVAAAVPDVAIPLALSVSGPAARFPLEQVPKVGSKLRKVVAELGSDLTTRPSSV